MTQTDRKQQNGKSYSPKLERRVDGRVRKECDSGQRPGLSGEERQRIKVLEREVRELRQANEILRKASGILYWAEVIHRRHGQA